MSSEISYTPHVSCPRISTTIANVAHNVTCGTGEALINRSHPSKYESPFRLNRKGDSASAGAALHRDVGRGADKGKLIVWRA
jgi:hypothetical protein